MTTTELVNYTPTETDRQVALRFIGWALREQANELCTSDLGGATYEIIQDNADRLLVTLQNAWDRYTERVGSR